MATLQALVVGGVLDLTCDCDTPRGDDPDVFTFFVEDGRIGDLVTATNTSGKKIKYGPVITIKPKG